MKSQIKSWYTQRICQQKGDKPTTFTQPGHKTSDNYVLANDSFSKKEVKFVIKVQIWHNSNF